MSGDRQFSFKYIADSVHGTIGVSKLELAVMDTAAFRRLRSVKQLGLAYVVYPTADYSRFSHSLGTCHVAGRLFNQLLGETASKDHAKDIQLHRLAGLLHDVGHYPFSHALEVAVSNYYSGAYLKDCGSVVIGEKEFFKDHEDVGLCVLETDQELRDAIAQNDLGITADDVSSIFKQPSTSSSEGSAGKRFPRLISGDVDADRLDYLLRTATATGLPYGNIDLDYLVSQVREDNKGRIAFGRNALRAIDQLLIARFFDYRQISFHKTVAAMEWLLVTVIPALLHVEQDLNLSKDGIKKRITDGEWGHLTDSYVWELIERHWRKAKDAPAADDDANRTRFTRAEVFRAQALLERRAPKLVAGVERFQRIRDDGDPNLHRLTVKMANDFIEEWADEFHIAKERWTVWERKITITKVGSKVSAARAYESGERSAGKYGETVRLLMDRSAASKAAINVPQSLTSILSEFDYRIIRIFVLFDENTTEEQMSDQRDRIFSRISLDMRDAGWTYPRTVIGSEDPEPAVGVGEGEDEDEDAITSTSPSEPVTDVAVEKPVVLPDAQPVKARTKAPAKARTKAPAKARTKAPAKARTKAPAKAQTRMPARARAEVPRRRKR